MLVFVTKFIIGLVLLLFATEKLVRLAERISRIIKISPLIVGLTIVAIGTSIPELVVSVVSMGRQDTDLAMGNIIGSNIVNVLLVLPVGILIGRLKIGRVKTQKSALFLLAGTLIFFVIQYCPIPKTYAGLFLIGLAAIYSIMEYRLGIVGRDHEDLKSNKHVKAGSVNLAQVIIGMFLLILIVIGGILVVDSVESLSLFTGLSTSILGLTLTAIATSLPELLTTIYSQNNKQEKLTVGNIIGSNVYNLMFIGGLLLLFPYRVVISSKEWFWLGSTTAGFVLFLKYHGGKRPSRISAIILFGILFIYLLFQ